MIWIIVPTLKTVGLIIPRDEDPYSTYCKLLIIRDFVGGKYSAGHLES